MKTLFKQYGIFNKDFRLLQKMMITVLLFQAVLMILIPPLILMLSQSRILDIPDMNFEDWFPKLQVALSLLFSLIVAGHWWAEERGGQNDILLFRLPISRSQMWLEKTSAGLISILILLLIQCLWAAFTISFGAKIADRPIEYYWLLSVVTLYAYFIGLPFSYYLKHTIAVIVLGLAMFLPTMFIYQLVLTTESPSRNQNVNHWNYAWDHIYEITKIAVSILPFILMVAVPVGLYIVTNVKKKKESNFTNQRFWVLVQKQYIEMKYYLLAAVILFLIGILFSVSILFSPNLTPNSFWNMITPMFLITAVIFSLLLGILTYQHNEKGGLNSVLYHHPISLSEIFWSKVFVNLCIASVISLAIIVPSMFVIFNNAEDFRQFNTLGLNDNKNALSVYFPLMLNLYFAKLLPFAVGVLMCHIVPNTIYAFLESVPFGIAASVLYLYLQFADETFTADYIELTGRQHPLFLPMIPWLLMLILTGLLLMGWRAATDRRLLTSTILQRHLYIARVFCFVLAVSVICSRAGFWDSLYLVTGIDLGVG